VYLIDTHLYQFSTKKPASSVVKIPGLIYKLLKNKVILIFGTLFAYILTEGGRDG